MILHTVNKSPATHSALTDCASVALAGDAVLLLENGVYAAVERTESEQVLNRLKEREVSVYAVKDDVEARGLSDSVSPVIKLVSYSEFVNLAVLHQSIQSWY